MEEMENMYMNWEENQMMCGCGVRVGGKERGILKIYIYWVCYNPKTSYVLRFGSQLCEREKLENLLRVKLEEKN